jgi:hypothetical protein
MGEIEIVSEVKETKPQKGKIVYNMLSKKEKISVLRDYDLNGFHVTDTCNKYSISKRFFYVIKKELWPEYVDMRGNEKRLSEFALVTKRSNEIRATVEIETSNTLVKCMKVIDIKLENELKRLAGDNTIKEKLRFDDITKFFAASAPYILKTDNGDDPARPKSIAEHHTYITNILNQQTHKSNGNNQNPNSGH